MSDVCNLEFLDLSDVDEREQIDLRASLRCNDPNVELPWITIVKKKSFKDINRLKNVIKQNDMSDNVPNHQNVHPTISSATYLNQFCQSPVVLPSMVAGHVQPNTGFFASTQQQSYAVPQNTVNNVNYNYSNATIVTQPPVTQQIYVHNNGTTNTHVEVCLRNNGIPNGQVNSVSPAPQQQTYTSGTLRQTDVPIPMVNKKCNTEAIQPIVNENRALQSPTAWAGNQNKVVQNGIQSKPIVKENRALQSPTTSTGNQSKVVQNGIQSRPIVNENQTLQSPTASTGNQSNVVQNSVQSKPESTTVNIPSTGKSWASLFSNSKSYNGFNFENADEDSRKAAVDKAVNKEANNNEVCPIKNPKISQFISPDCYRMGEYLTSYTVDGRVVSLQPRGLINRSNYCYINSILQALIACPPLYNLLSGLQQNISSNEKRNPTPIIDGMCRFVKEFNHLPANMRLSNRRSEGKNPRKNQATVINTDTPLEPAWMHKMLNRLRSDLIEGRQEDAEEFLGCLLNGLNDEMLELIKLVNKKDCDQTSPANNSESENDPNKDWLLMGPKNKDSVTRRTDFGRTPISDIFGGFLKSRIHRAGDHVSENIQPFFTLQLNIKKVNTVQEALEALVTKYQLEGLTSSKTNEEVEAWQQVMLDELPVILVLHLKCFDFKRNGCTKIVKALEFPVDLKIDPKLLSSSKTHQTQKEKQYKLFAVVYHDGWEASKGHYTTDAFHVGYSSWLRYDDASVDLVQEEEVLKPQGTRVPYLLFYRRSDTIRSK